MREILFRGQKPNGEWVQGDLLHISSGCIIYHGSQTESEIKENTGAAIELLINEISVVKPKTVGQFTGLTDKNGVKIFEGDILKVGENLIAEITYIEENVQDYGDEMHSAFQAVIQKHNKTIPIDSYLLNNCKIIGNIHDNPELLK